MEKTLARVFGGALLLFGLVGFFSNSLVGSAGYFYADAGMNIINLIAGILLVSFSATEKSSARALRIAGGTYFAIAVIGFAITATGATANVLGFMGVNMAASWLYVIAGILMFGAGFAESKQAMMLHDRKSHA